MSMHDKWCLSAYNAWKQYFQANTFMYHVSRIKQHKITYKLNKYKFCQKYPACANRFGIGEDASMLSLLFPRAKRKTKDETKKKGPNRILRSQSQGRALLRGGRWYLRWLAEQRWVRAYLDARALGPYHHSPIDPRPRYAVPIHQDDRR